MTVAVQRLLRSAVGLRQGESYSRRGYHFITVTWLRSMVLWTALIVHSSPVWFSR